MASSKSDEMLRKRCHYEGVATEDQEAANSSRTAVHEAKSQRRLFFCLFLTLVIGTWWTNVMQKRSKSLPQNSSGMASSSGRNVNTSTAVISKHNPETTMESNKSGADALKKSHAQNQLKLPCIAQCEAKNRVWDVCRTWEGCTGCAFCETIKRCDDECIAAVASNEQHGNVCTWRNCSYCYFCFKPCSVGVKFRDVTRSILKDPYFDQWKHSGKPYGYFDSPLFVDLNGDGVLDLFNSMHFHNIKNKSDYKNIFELAESVPNNEDDKKADYFFKPVPHRIIIEDDPGDIDAHGRNVLDLDGDGVLDIMIASGGGKGEEMKRDYALTRDNLLLWGERGVDQVIGEPTTIFRGGRVAARRAGVEMPLGRNRVNYMFDANGDGLIDIFCLMDRPVTNSIIPGVLLINQGNRTWKEDTSMREYTSSMILTDADGDGIANEIVLSRGFCYPQRASPGVDPKYPDLGPFTKEIREFCSTRPVGSLAVFKYNHSLQRMEEISTKFSNLSPNDKQPDRCPHGSWSGDNDCHARSMVSGDFDGDLVADLVIMYQNKMDFFFSTDRAPGTLPTQANFVIEFPVECKGGSTVRLLDLNNDGRQELLVMCDRPGAKFLLYTQGSDKKDWNLQDDCNAVGALGDIANGTLAEFAKDDLADSCKLMRKVDYLRHACKYKQGKQSSIPLQAAGLSTVDLNNDGFVDMVTSYKFGYNRYFYNAPSDSERNNRFISFKLSCASSKNTGKGNACGIGATLILEGECDGNAYNQFKEISSYQHTTEKYGYNDDCIIFGLRTNIHPVQLFVTWSNGIKQNVSLSDWNYAPNLGPISIVQIST